MHAILGVTLLCMEVFKCINTTESRKVSNLPPIPSIGCQNLPPDSTVLKTFLRSKKIMIKIYNKNNNIIYYKENIEIIIKKSCNNQVPLKSTFFPFFVVVVMCILKILSIFT